MKASVTFEIESAEELVALGQFFDQFGFNSGGAADGKAAPTKGKVGRPRKQTAEQSKQPEEPAVDLGMDDEDEPAEEITKAIVAKELRAFIKDKGEKDGPTLALATLKQFDASKFDELKEADYGKFLSKLKQAG